MKTKHVLAGLLALSSAPLYAVENGTAVTESQYDAMNYFVNIVTDKGSCGGQLIAGQWILTARHCTSSWDADGSGDKSDDLATDGDTITIKVYQGVGGYVGYYDGNSRLVYDGDGQIYTMGGQTEALSVIETLWNNSGIEAALSSIFLEGNMSDGSLVETAYTYDNVDVNFSDIDDSDLALIKLDDAIAYKTTLKLGLISDFEQLFSVFPSSMAGIVDWTNTQTMNTDQTFTYYGWGKTANNTTPSEMRYGTQTVKMLPMDVSCTYWVSFKIVNESDGTYTTDDSNKYDCTQDAYNTFTSNSTFHSYFPELSVDINTYMEAEGDDALSGDSGTALMIDNTMYGVTSSTAFGLSSNYQSLESQMSFILGKIDGLNVPTKMEFLNSDNVTSFDIEVQNLSASSQALDIATTETGVILDTSDCDAYSFLESLASCTISVTLDSEFDASEFTIQVNGSTNTVVSFVDSYTGDLYKGASDGSDDVTSIDGNDDSSSDSSTSGSGGGGGGGSTGPLALIGLLGALILRRKEQKKCL
ncbi:trypsin-like serine protease [Vibrio sp. Y2-5]|uniref:trypsin-like serine protease n=1 Tax=Vibrio sp. Y2-5 TaxID=2743977 RepID=UPI0016618238|nr:trypsin-like serine protease [Vibrio sp. Y2-5]MBD0788232.1 trypsin-like serine protease [Vibrio sp. Y2-5]